MRALAAIAGAGAYVSLAALLYAYASRPVALGVNALVLGLVALGAWGTSESKKDDGATMTRDQKNEAHDG